jgi:hypothetical protein
VANISKQIPTKWVVWGALGILVLIGIGWSLTDYIQWRRLETSNYGQGWADLQTAAKPLTWEYTNTQLGVTMVLPAEWLGQDVKKFFSLRKGFGTEAEKKVWEEELPGGRVMVHQRLAKNINKQVIVMETSFAQEDWGEWESTISEIFKTIKPSGEYSNSDELTVEQDKTIQKALDGN